MCLAGNDPIEFEGEKDKMPQIMKRTLHFPYTTAIAKIEDDYIARM
jgi:hypothetical protein